MTGDFSAVRSPFRMQPGLSRVPEGAPQLHPHRPGQASYDEKLAVLRAHPQRALCAADGIDPVPALSALCAEAARWWPDHFGWDGECASVEPLGWRVDRAGQLSAGVPHGADAAVGRLLLALPPAQRLGALLALAFEEDLALVDAEHGTIPWLAVCLPSHWVPAEKVGRAFTEVHAPVADNALVMQAAPQLLRLVTGPERWQRGVWTLSADARLNGHPERDAPRRWPTDATLQDPEALYALAHWRTEQQSFVPLPARRQAVFTIRVQVEPLAAVITSAERARQLHDALASMSPAVLAYRSLGAVQPGLCAALAARAGSV